MIPVPSQLIFKQLSSKSFRDFFNLLPPFSKKEQLLIVSFESFQQLTEFTPLYFYNGELNLIHHEF